MELSVAKKLAESLMSKHGLETPKWKFQFDHAKKRFGVCKIQKNRLSNEIICGTIGLSKYLVLANNEEAVLDTILHEIAHALTPGHGHDSVWKRKCIEIGAKPERCFTDKTVNMESVKGRYQATCGGCGKTFTKHRMTRRVVKQACRCQTNKSWENKILLKFIDVKAVK